MTTPGIFITPWPDVYKSPPQAPRSNLNTDVTKTSTTVESEVKGVCVSLSSSLLNEMRFFPESDSSSIEADPGLFSKLKNIYNSDATISQKLHMTLDTGRYHFQTSEAAQGAVQAAGGGVEVAGAIGLGSTGAGVFVGVPLAFHGGDNIGTGLSRIFLDAPQNTSTYSTIEYLTGSPQIAREVDNAIPLLGGVASVGQAVKALTAGGVVGGVSIVRTTASAEAGGANAVPRVLSEQQAADLLLFKEMSSGPATGPVKFGQIGVSPKFSRLGNFQGALISDVANSIKAGDILPGSIKVNVIRWNGQYVAVNNRSLTVLSQAGHVPTNIVDITESMSMSMCMGNPDNVFAVVQRLREINLNPSSQIGVRSVDFAKNPEYFVKIKTPEG